MFDTLFDICDCTAIMAFLIFRKGIVHEYSRYYQRTQFRLY